MADSVRVKRLEKELVFSSIWFSSRNKKFYNNRRWQVIKNGGITQQLALDNKKVVAAILPLNFDEDLWIMHIDYS